MNPLPQTLSSPFYACIRCNGRYHDDTLLAALGLSDSELYGGQDQEPTAKCIFLSDHADWTMVFADWHCQALCYDPDFVQRVADFSKIYDVFYGYVADVDPSYGVTYFQNGKLKKKLIVDGSNWSHPPVTIEDIGKTLSSVANFRYLTSERDKVYLIAESLGVPMPLQSFPARGYKLNVELW